MLNDAGVGAEMMKVISDNVESLVKECRELEEGFGTSFTDELLGGARSVGLGDVRKEIRKIDRKDTGGVRQEITAYCGGGVVKTGGQCDGLGAQACQGTAESEQDVQCTWEREQAVPAAVCDEELEVFSGRTHYEGAPRETKLGNDV